MAKKHRQKKQSAPRKPRAARKAPAALLPGALAAVAPIPLGKSLSVEMAKALTRSGKPVLSVPAGRYASMTLAACKGLGVEVTRKQIMEWYRLGRVVVSK